MITENNIQDDIDRIKQRKEAEEAEKQQKEAEGIEKAKEAQVLTRASLTYRVVALMRSGTRAADLGVHCMQRLIRTDADFKSDVQAMSEELAERCVPIN